MKLLFIEEIRFALVIIILKRFKTIKRGLQNLVLREKWTLYKDDDVGKAELSRAKYWMIGSGTRLTIFFHSRSLFITC